MIAQPMLQTPQTLDVLSEAGRWPAQGKWCYEDYLRLPDDGKRYEIIKGVLYVANAPSFDHQLAVARLTTMLTNFVTAQNLGIVLNAPFEVHLSESSHPVQPDVLVLLRQQIPTTGTQFFSGAPALIVEVISPSSFRLDRKIKFDAYEEAGVAEYWIVDPKTRSVEVNTLSSGEYALLGQYTGEDAIESNVLPGILVKASLLFVP